MQVPPGNGQRPFSPLPVSDDRILSHCGGVLIRARKIIEDHTDAGENEKIPLGRMFPHGLADLDYQIFTKAARIVGYEHRIYDDREKFISELLDIINYAAFAVTWVELSHERAMHESSTDTPDQPSSDR